MVRGRLMLGAVVPQAISPEAAVEAVSEHEEVRHARWSAVYIYMYVVI